MEGASPEGGFVKKSRWKNFLLTATEVGIETAANGGCLHSGTTELNKGTMKVPNVVTNAANSGCNEGD